MMHSKHKKTAIGVLCALAMSVLILDAKHALLGAKDGIFLCLYSVIPALFPFCVLSIMFRSMITGASVKLLSPLERLCGIPRGSGLLFILGALGGYPVGAVCIEQARKNGDLSQSDADRMVSFCNNAGPSFIFGMLIITFGSFGKILLIWMIQLFSAILTGALLPNKSKDITRPVKPKQIGFKQAFDEAIRSMVNVCGFVILFRVIITILDRWVLWLFSNEVRVILTGMLELTNGVHSINIIEDESIRFIAACAILSFGGICVTMQTAAISGPTVIKKYFSGKLLQCSISVIIATGIQAINNPALRIYFLIILAIIIPAMIILRILTGKKTVAFPTKILYNTNS